MKIEIFKKIVENTVEISSKSQKLSIKILAKIVEIFHKIHLEYLKKMIKKSQKLS